MNAFEKINNLLWNKQMQALSRFNELDDLPYNLRMCYDESDLEEVIAQSFEEAQQIVSEVESEFNNGWIPCEKELPPQPEENPEFDGKPLEVYLVSFKGTKYPWRAFWNGKDFTDGWSIVHPEAWMPLPESYKQIG